MADESVVPPAEAEKMRKKRQDRRDAVAARKAYDKATVYPDTKKALDAPIVPMVRSRGALVPRFLKDTPDNAPIREMKDLGRGLEIVPDSSPKKLVRGGGIESRGKTKGRFV